MIKKTGFAISACWRSPSNLAIVKYWGKKGIQEPANPSISFSLDKSFTQTRVDVNPDTGGGFTFLLNGEKKEGFKSKIEIFIERVKPFLPFLNSHHITINSSNSFPHSSGIASSASSMSALAFCLVSVHNQLQKPGPVEIDKTMASAIARLGSGSACRSAYGNWNIWGKTPEIKNSSDIYAVEIECIHQTFKKLHDTILIIDANPKKVSSTIGHNLMENHPYRRARINQAFKNTSLLLNILQTGNLDGFFNIAELEALSIHGLMMSSNPSYTLLHPNTLIAIEKIKAKRFKDGLPVGFSLDAGPNIHLLYPHSHFGDVQKWVNDELKYLCVNNEIINDKVGSGAQNITD